MPKITELYTPLMVIMADKEKQVDIPGKAQVKNSIRNVENQHESRRQLISGFHIQSCLLSLNQITFSICKENQIDTS